MALQGPIPVEFGNVLIYLHATDERQREIADALGDLAAGELNRPTGRNLGGRPG